MGGKNHRRIILSNGAHALVDTLSRREIKCILISDIAAHLLGSGSVPKDIKIVIMPTYEGCISKDKVATLLVEDNPSMFRVRQRKDKTTVLSYFDSVIKPPKKTWCDIELISVRNPPPPEYTVQHVKYVNGLPVGSMLPLVIDKLRSLFLAYHSNNRSLPPTNVNYKRFKKLLSRSSINWDHGHESFRQEALRNLFEASSIFPELSPQLSKLIQDCRRASSLLQEAPSNLLLRNRSTDGDSDLPEDSPEISIVKSLSEIPVVQPQSVPQLESPDQQASYDAFRTEVICLIAKQVVNVVHQSGAECALFGSLACYLYGNTRPPNDIDLIVFPGAEASFDAEKVKQDIADLDPVHFSLESPRDPTAIFRVLYFLVDEDMAPPHTFHKNKCKIDVLVPPLLHLPRLSAPEIKHRDGLPVVPFPLLLLQKLQGWDDHRRMKEYYKFEKHVTDAVDVQCLLELEHVVSLRFARPWDNSALFSPKFMHLSRQRIRDFSHIYPESAAEWRRLGFSI